MADRSASRLLRIHRSSGQIEHRTFRDVIHVLAPGDLLVVNDTRVSALRLQGTKDSGGAVEGLLMSGGPVEFEALLKPGRRLKPGARVNFGPLRATVVCDLADGLKRLRFDEIPNLAEELQAFGSAPLPPYIHERLADKERYQTVYGTQAGSAAAPTAGLHFTPEILSSLEAHGVEIANVTLHVGLDTFRPVQVENLDEHTMHGESCSISSDTARKIRQCTGRIVAVGTTAVRTLESFANGHRSVATGEMTSKLFIRPGYEFKIVDGMFTNFHLPKTTMLTMISALAGRDIVLSAYAEAVRERYRFLSFGDSMLIL